MAIKSYFDQYCLRGKLPPEIEGKVVGKLFPDIATLRKWRSWKETNLCYKDEFLNATLSGALDDCLIENDFYIPLDYKTRGTDLKEDPRKYYQAQLDCYCLMLESSGYKTNNLAYLVYYWPEDVREYGIVKFNVMTVKIETNIDAAKKIFQDAIKALMSGIPKTNKNCDYCNYRNIG